MNKVILFFVFIVNVSFGQISLKTLINDSWEVPKKDILSMLKITNYEAKESMGYKGYIIHDSLNSIPINYGYMFNSSDVQNIRVLVNKMRTKEMSDKLFNYLFSYLNKNFGNSVSDNTLMGARSITWKDKKCQITLNYSLDTSMLFISKLN